MHVIATAGHVDHGKSTLVRLLTGMEPDRWAQEQRRGITIDLGFGWTTMDDGCTLAFVDVPGHERFVPTMLTGIGPAPAVMFIVAADEGWMPQSAEHLDALNALGVRHGLLVVTRCDLADPSPATREATHELRKTSLRSSPVVHVSGSSGKGLESLREALDDLVHQLPDPDTDADVRLWIDRAFTIQGAGTVVTGTLQAGTLRTGDELRVHPGDTPVSIRGLHSLGQAESEVSAVARVAVNVRGISFDALRRGYTLLSPARWLSTEQIDVRLRGADAQTLPRELVLHIGSFAGAVRVRPLGRAATRLTLRSPVPLRIGDQGVLRDPGHRSVVSGFTVLDVRPPALARRGAARERAADLATRPDRPDGAGELHRRRLIRADELHAMGVTPPKEAIQTGKWLIDESYRQELSARLVELVDRYQREHPLSAGIAPEAARRALDLPDQDLLTTLLRTGTGSTVALHDGRLRVRATEFPDPVRQAIDAVQTELRVRPFGAPTAGRLRELGLGETELAAAASSGELLRLTPGVVLLPSAPTLAAELLVTLPAPFTVSDARRLLATSRRVVIPLMELLVHDGYTERMADGRHRLRG